LADKIAKKYGKADIIFSSNTLAHIEDMHDVYRGIKKLLKDDGMLVFENHYLGNLIQEFQYDMMYHEHQYYYTLSSLTNFLNQFDLEIFDVKFIPIHAGSISVYVQNKGSRRKIKKIVSETLKKEQIQKLTQASTFKKFNKKILKNKQELLKTLKLIKNKNKKIAGYGASGRGTIITNYCGLDNKFLDYVIDDAPAKQGAYMPGVHLPIKSSGLLSDYNRPDYILLFAWSFANEILKKNTEYIKSGGKFIVPLPKVKIL
jgi:methylation protein EvaC